MSAIKNLIEFRFIQKYPEYRNVYLYKIEVEDIPENEVGNYSNTFSYLKPSNNETMYKIVVKSKRRGNFDYIPDDVDLDPEYNIEGVCIAYVKNDKVTDIRNLYWI